MISAEFHSPQEIHRLLHLVHRDLARVRGNILIAQERLDEEVQAGKGILPGNVRKQARQTVETGPEQQAVLEGAQDALRAALAAARENGQVG